ncbi:monocarboxylate transporter 13-like [Mytilus trossulus]|uniref:monocarboxylate transporter 13-like n=1 Tax=Mytilus trossulus TaxID=6551 RepID=UPI003005F814
MLENDKLDRRDTSSCTNDHTSSSDDNNGTDLLNKGANKDREKTSVTQEITEKDSGWAWIIALATSLHVFLLVGFAKSFGLFFVQFIDVYGTSSSMTSVIIAVQTLVTSISSLFVLNIGTKMFSVRSIIIIGAILSSAGYMLNAFSPNITFLVFSHGIIYGLSCAFATGPMFVVLNASFEKRLGIAYSIAMVGGCIGSFTLPILIQTLLDKYGLQGALLVCSGMHLNNIVAGALIRSPRTPKVKRRTGKDAVLQEILDPEQDLKSTFNRDLSVSDSNVKRQIDNRSQPIHFKIYHSGAPRTQSESHDNGATKNDVHVNTSLQDFFKTLSRSAINIYNTTDTAETFSSMHSVGILRHNSEDDDESVKHKRSFKVSCHDLLGIDLLKNHSLQAALFAAFLAFFGLAFIVAYIPAFANDNGITQDRLAILLTITGVCDLVSRILLGILIDSNKIKRKNILSFSLFVTGVATLFNPFYTTFQTFAIYSVIYGLFGSLYFSLMTMLMREGVGPDKLPAALSLQIFIHGISSIVFAPLLGYIRDKTGSYTVSFYVMGSALLIASIVIFCEPLVKKLEDRRVMKLQRKSNDDEDVTIHMVNN